MAGKTYVRDKRNIKQMEAMAILEGLKHLQNMESYPILLETDSLEVEAFNGRRHGHHRNLLNRRRNSHFCGH